jgi:hypothetical protein
LKTAFERRFCPQWQNNWESREEKEENDKCDKKESLLDKTRNRGRGEGEGKERERY